MKRAELEERYSDQGQELQEARDTNNRLVTQLSASRKLADRLVVENGRLLKKNTGWAEIVDKSGKVIRSGLCWQVSHDAVNMPDPSEWRIAFLTDFEYKTTVQFLYDDETYTVKTDQGERLLVRQEVRP